MKRRSGLLIFFIFFVLGWISPVKAMTVDTVQSHFVNKNKAQKKSSRIIAKSKGSLATLKSTGKDTVRQRKNKIWEVRASLGRTDRLVKNAEADSNPSNDVELGIGVTLLGDYLLSGLINYSQYQKDAESNDFGRATVGLTKVGMKVWDRTFLLSPGLSFGLPVSRAAADASLLGSLTAQIGLALNRERMAWDNLNLSVGTMVTRNFHQFETAKFSGRVNTQYGWINSFSAGMTAFEKLNFQLNLLHVITMSYENTRQEFYGHSEEMSFAFTENLNLSLGHTILLAPIRKANGEDLSLKVTDELNSQYYARIGFSF
jgi:hypothetical protein